MEYAVLLKNISKRFSTPHNPRETHLAVDSVTLELREGEFMAMVGPRGCGKSTILRLIAGLEQPTAGEIYVHGRRVDSVPAGARNVGFTFQGHALFKNMTVTDNISFGLKIKKVSKKDRRRRVEELVALMGLEGLEGRKPYQLSGEQQQRVAWPGRWRLSRGTFCSTNLLAPWTQWHGSGCERTPNDGSGSCRFQPSW